MLPHTVHILSWIVKKKGDAENPSDPCLILSIIPLYVVIAEFFAWLLARLVAKLVTCRCYMSTISFHLCTIRKLHSTLTTMLHGGPTTKAIVKHWYTSITYIGSWVRRITTQWTHYCTSCNTLDIHTIAFFKFYGSKWCCHHVHSRMLI